MTVYNMYKCIYGGVSYTIECNSLKAAFQPLTPSPSADSPILKYQPVLAFCPKREIILLPSNTMTSEEILRCYSNSYVIRQGCSDHLSSLQQPQLIACSGSLNTQCKIFQSLILKLIANFMPIEAHNYYKKAKEMDFIFPSEVLCTDFYKAITNSFTIS